MATDQKQPPKQNVVHNMIGAAIGAVICVVYITSCDGDAPKADIRDEIMTKEERAQARCDNARIVWQSTFSDEALSAVVKNCK